MHDHQTHTVYTRERWSDDWTEREYLYADTVRFACSPDMGSASLVYEYGEKVRPDEKTFQVFAKLDVLEHYVKIEIDQPDDDAGDPVDALVWHGVIVEPTDMPLGVIDETPSGVQSFVAVGLEYLLDRKVIDTSVVEGFGGDDVLHRAIGFNLGGGNPRDATFAANRSADPGAAGNAYIFASELEGAEPWRVNDILDYLLTHHAPVDRDDDPPIRWRVDAFSQWLDLEWYVPSVQVHGRTVKQILDTLVNRTRLFGYRVSVTDDDEVWLSVFTFNATDIDTPSGKTINSNVDAIDWDFSAEPRVKGTAIIKQSAAHVHQVVVARGERRTTTATLSAAFYDGDYVADWTDDAETAYLAGATETVGYDGLELPDQQAENRRVRQGPALRRVYRNFRVPASWWGYYPTEQPLCPDAGGKAMAVWRGGVRMLDHVPLLEGHDYKGNAIDSGTVESSLPDGSELRPLRPFAVIQTPGADELHYEFVDRLQASPDFGTWSDALPREWNMRFDVYREGIGFTLSVQGSQQQHAIASADFTAADTADGEDWDGELDWKNTKATVALECDAFAEVKWPAGKSDNSREIVKTMIVRVPGARLDYVMPGTVVGLDDAGALITSTGGYVRDDRERLRDIARMAYEWYNTERRALTVTIATIECAKTVGQLIETIGTGPNVETVNTVITSIDFDLKAGSHTVKTAFAELDAGGFA
jgi:hypothetical protein